MGALDEVERNGGAPNPDGLQKARRSEPVHGVGHSLALENPARDRKSHRRIAQMHQPHIHPPEMDSAQAPYFQGRNIKTYRHSSSAAQPPQGPTVL